MRSLLVVAIVAVAMPAFADDTDVPLAFHKGQVGISARLGVGAYGIATYDGTVYCGKSDPARSTGNAAVCTGRSPFALDLEGSYGVTGTIELTLELRIGLERYFGGSPALEGPRPFHLAPGARFFFSEAKRAKLFVQPELVFDFTGFQDTAGNSRGTDFGVKGIEGFWVDLHKTYGLYVYVGETAEFSHWLYFGFEGGFGFQGRYP